MHNPPSQPPLTTLHLAAFSHRPTKPDAPRAEIKLLQQAKRNYETPVCAIGGITPQNAHSLLACRSRYDRSHQCGF